MTKKIKKVWKKIVRKCKGQKIRIGDFVLKTNRGHSLMAILETYPDYGANLVRLAKGVATKYKAMRIIDVGANIGDSVAMLLNDNPNYEIMAIEGDTAFFKILSDNFSYHTHVSLHKHFLSDTRENARFSTQKHAGTLKINSNINNKTSSEINLTTLDLFIDGYPHYKQAKLLKIDTDGYDTKIIRGAETYLKATKPVIFFEYDSSLLQANNENGLDTFDFLIKCGYKTAVFFDNYGRFLLSTDIIDKKLIRELDRYIKERKGAFAYYDIAVFHSVDDDIAISFIKSENMNA